MSKKSRRRRNRWIRAAKRAGGSTLHITGEAAEFEIQAAEGDGEQQQRLRRFTMTAYTGGAMRVPQYYWPVVVDLSGVTVATQQRPILYNHNPDEIIGHADKIEVTSQRIKLSGVISGVNDRAREVVQLADNGFPWQASIGAPVEQIEFVDRGNTVKVNGRVFSGPIYVARKATLREVSFVALGADDNTSARVAASDKEHAMNFEQWLRAKGFDADTLSDEQKTILRAAYDAEQDQPEPAGEPTQSDGQPQRQQTNARRPVQATATPPDDRGDEPRADDLIAQLRAGQAAEVQRIEQVRTICARYDRPTVEVNGQQVPLEAHAIAEGWSAERTELHALRAARPRGPAIHVADTPIRSGVIEAALCMQAGVPVENQYDEQTLDRASRFRRRGLRWCVEQICASQGRPIDADPGTAEWIRAAFSSNELSGIVGNVANKALQSAFAATPSVAAQITATRSHTNFHAHTVYSLALGGELEQVAPDGELAHLKLSEESRTRQVATRGAVLSITRQDLINDDLGAFAQNAAALGRKAVTAREKALFTILNATGAGSSFFTAARGNYFDGASSALSSSSLATAVQMFRDQTGPDGDPIMIDPRVLLVPTSLEVTARELMNSEFVVGPSSSKTPNRNIWRGAFDPVTSPWLSNSNLTGYSTTAWYLLADPNDVAALEIAYLNGQQTPTVEFFGLDSDPNVLGVTWRVYWDFGAALAEYRAGVKSKGAA